MVRQIHTLSEFEKVLADSGDQLIVVDFTATWCGPCQNIAPVFQNLSIEFPNIVFVKVDVDENNETAEKYNVNSMPTFAFFKNKDLKHQFSGASEHLLRQAISEFK